MKNKRNFTFIMIMIALLIIIGIIIAVVKSKNCNCKTTPVQITNLGKVEDSKETTKGNIPSFTLYINGDKTYTISNANINQLKLYEYKVITSINNKKDESTWLGIKLADLLNVVKEDKLGTSFKISSTGASFTKMYKSTDNLYIFFNKNNKMITVSKKNILIVADITKDSKYWLYDPQLITKN